MRTRLELDLDFFVKQRDLIQREADEIASTRKVSSTRRDRSETEERDESLSPLILPVTKYLSGQDTRRLLEADQGPLGENRAQELEDKTDPGQDPGGWHFIGKLQRNKISLVAPRIELLHSLDSLKLAQTLNHWVEDNLGRSLSVLVQINIAGEHQKSGLDPLTALNLIPEWISQFDSLRFEGLMTMAPQLPAEECRPIFRALRQLRDEISDRHEEDSANSFKTLSMGMSNDWRVAVAEGATILRLGRTLLTDEKGG